MPLSKCVVPLLLAAVCLPPALSSADERARVAQVSEPGEADTPPTAPKRYREDIEVVAEEPADVEAPSELPVRPVDVMAVAGAGENVFRTLQTLPGVAATTEFDSRIAVRGGAPDENLTVMDGVEIHNPYRLFGLTSAFNPETVRGFELTAGAFSSKYGDRLSSLLVVENRPGTEARGFAGSTAMSLTDANVVLEGKPAEASRAARGSSPGAARTTTWSRTRSSARSCPPSTTCRPTSTGSRGPAPASRFSACAAARRPTRPSRAIGRASRVTSSRRRGTTSPRSLRDPARTRGSMARTTASYYDNATGWARTRSSATRRAARTPRRRDRLRSRRRELHARPRRARPRAAPGGRAEAGRHTVETGFELHDLRTSTALADRGRPQHERGERLERPGRRRAAGPARLGVEQHAHRRLAAGPLAAVRRLSRSRAGCASTERASTSARRCRRASSTLRLGDRHAPACRPAGCSPRAPATRSWCSPTTSSTSRDSRAALSRYERATHAMLGFERDCGPR